MFSILSVLWHIPLSNLPISGTSTEPLDLSSSPCGLGGRWEAWSWTSALCVCGTRALCPWTFHSVTEFLLECIQLVREEHSCVLSFICIAASWSHKMRHQERQWHTAYKGRVRVRTGDERERERERAQAESGNQASRLGKANSIQVVFLKWLQLLL